MHSASLSGVFLLVNATHDPEGGGGGRTPALNVWPVEVRKKR